MKKCINAAVVLLLLLSASRVFPQESFDLKYKFEKGKTYLYRTIYSSEISRDVNGQETISKGDGILKLRMAVVDVNNGKMEIITSRDSMYSKISNRMGGDDIINNGDEFVGKRAKLIYNIYGKKLDVVEMDSSKNAMGTNVAPTSAMFLQLSDKPVKIGDEWTITTSDTNKLGETGLSTIKTESKYKAEGKEIINGAAYLKISVKVVSKSEISMSTQGMNMVSEGTNNTTGTILFDISGGMIYSYDTESDSNSVMTYVEQNRTIPTNQKAKSSVRYIGNE